MGQTHLSMDRETFCFQGLSLRMPMPKPERKNSSPVVTRSHFCEASNSSTAESQMKAWSLLPAEAESKEPCGACSPHPAHTGVDSLHLSFLGEGAPPCLSLYRPAPSQGSPWSACSLVPHSLDGLSCTLVIVLLHVPVHGAQLHLPPEVDVHRALFYSCIDELV